ncbi:Transcription initiation factor TFIID subunit 2 [Savitreella phatthalungensis]
MFDASHFTLTHQRVFADVDFANRRLQGWTEISLTPLAETIDSAAFHLIESQVQRCEVNGQECEWQHVPLKLKLDDGTFHQHSTLHHKLSGLNRTISNCDLNIKFPKTIQCTRDAADGSWSTVVVKIWFSCSPQLSFQWAEDYAYTVNEPLPHGLGGWLPCLDGFWERCTWEMSIRTRSDLNVFCSGDLMEERLDGRARVHSFSQMSATGAAHIGFAIGKFKTTALSDLRESDEDDAMGSNAVDIFVHHLAVDAVNVRASTSFLYKVVDHFVKEHGSYPYTAYRLVVLPDMASDSINLASCTFVSDRLLLDERQIDPYPLIRQLTFLLASQWAGISMLPREWQDRWVTVGLAYHMTDLFLRKLFGVNDRRFRLKTAMMEVVRRDIGYPGICSSDAMALPLDPDRLDFVGLKSGVVMHMLDRRMTKGGNSLGLARVVPKIFLQTMSGELANGLITTAYFLRQCEKAAHIKLDDFSRQWIYGNGYPKFAVVQRLNKRKSTLELGIRQGQFSELSRPPMSEDLFVHDAARYLTKDPVAQTELVFTGPMTIRIYEPDGTPHEHIVDVKEQFTKVDIPYDAKSRRGKPDILRLGQDIDDPMPAQLEDSEEDDMVEWLRVDADVEWLCKMSVGQREEMYAAQLAREGDVVGQYEAVEHFCNMKPSPRISAILYRTLMDDRYYFGIRQMAARGLARCSREAGVAHLWSVFSRRYCYDNHVPRENNFVNAPEYFVRTALVSAIADVKGRDVLLQQLTHYDDSLNPVDGSAYLAHLIFCTGRALCDTETTKSDLGQALEQIRRHERMDSWRPTFRHRITVATLQVHEMLMSAGLQELDYEPYMQAIAESRPFEVRIQAYRSMLVLGALRHEPLARLLFFALLNDPSAAMRRQLGIAIELGIGAMAMRPAHIKPKRWTDEDDVFVVEEDTVSALDDRRDRESRASLAGAIQRLREEFGGEHPPHDIHRGLWRACNSTVLDPMVRRRLLDVCKLLYTSRPRQILRFRLPSMRARTVCRRTSPNTEAQQSLRMVIKKEYPLSAFQRQDRLKIRLRIA